MLGQWRPTISGGEEGGRSEARDFREFLGNFCSFWEIPGISGQAIRACTKMSGNFREIPGIHGEVRELPVPTATGVLLRPNRALENFQARLKKNPERTSRVHAACSFSSARAFIPVMPVSGRLEYPAAAPENFQRGVA